MEIQKLEIFGFKSFKNKTVLEFKNEGITGIVGPNGCGKSNIVDALLWVMGETSPKHLRSTSLSDVIFSGTSKEAPSGMAEVSLILGQGENGFPEKYKNFSEVMITRRSTRDGKTEYFINQQPCLLRDIKEIFMDTGAGCRGFSIIEQEAIEKLITAKPHERRFIIEEVAGITKFKTRKGESIRKLDLVNQNLSRLDDIIKTQDKQMNHLSAQAKKAEKYRNLKKDIQSREVEVLYRMHQEISEEQETLKKRFLNQKEERENLEKSITEKQNLLKETEQQIETQQTTLEKDKTYLTEVSYKVLERQKEIENLEKSILFYGENIKKQEESENQQKQDLDLSNKKIEEAHSQKQNFTQQEEDIKREILKIEEFLSNKKDASLISQKKGEIETVFQKINNEKLNKEAEASGIEKHISVISREQSKLHSEKTNLEDQIKQTLRTKDKTQSLLEKSQQTKLNFDKDLSNIKENIKSLELKKSNLDKETGDLNQNISLLQYKIEELKKLIHQFENLNEGTLHLSKWKPDSFKPLFKNLQVEAEFETALGAILGSHSHALISNDISSIEAGIKELKETRKGKSSFLSSLPTDTNSPIIPKETLQKYPAFICYLEEKIHFTLENTPLKSLVHHTVVVSNLSDALQMKEKFPSLQFVTKEGDFITKDSIVCGGSSQKETNLFKLHNQIEKNQQELKSNKTTLEFKLVDLNKTKKLLEQTIGSLEISQNQNNHSSENILSCKKDLERLEKELLRLSDSKSNSQKNWDNFEEEKQDLLKHQHSLQDEVLSLNKMIEKQSEELKSLENIEGKYKDEESKKIELQIKALEVSKEQSNLDQEIKFLTEIIKRSQSKTDENSKSKQEILTLIEKEQSQIQSIRQELELFLEEKSQLEKLIESNNNIKEEKKTLREQHLKDLQKSQEILTQIAIDKSTYQSEQEKLDIKKQNISEKIYENHQIKMEEQAFVPQHEDTPINQLKEDLSNLQEKLEKMSTVNLLALTEYEDLSKENQFLVHQQEDLVNSKKELHKVIHHIDEICDKRFRDMLEEINLRFSKVFPVIFDGENAEASLILEKGEDATEPGIDIMVRPPGKRPQSVTLLSRGEKALTSICLIYALFLVKPSPFCIVDEIDSPLDDANVFRLISVLKEMSRKSQIITITHNKYTMKSCKKLYGVTMQQPGISQLVSVDMEKQDFISNEKTII